MKHTCAKIETASIFYMGVCIKLVREANSEDPDDVSDPSGSILFAQACLSQLGLLR